MQASCSAANEVDPVAVPADQFVVEDDVDAEFGDGVDDLGEVPG